MTRRLGWTTSGALALAIFIGGASRPALAQGSAGLFGGIYEPDDDLDRTEVFGLRGGYRFAPNFGFEASLGRVDLADALPDEDDFLDFFSSDLQAELYALDLSFQWFPTGSGLVVFAGPGWSRVDAELDITIFGESFSFSDSEDILTAHAGVGYEWEVGERFYVRPEARVRRFFGDDEPEETEGLSISYQATDYEATVTFGIRLGER